MHISIVFYEKQLKSIQLSQMTLYLYVLTIVIITLHKQHNI